MLRALADVMRGRHDRPSMTLPVRTRSVQREKNRVRCGWLRRHARIARGDRHDSWRAWRWDYRSGAQTRSGDPVGLHGTKLGWSCRAVTRSQRDRSRARVRVHANTTMVVPTCDARGAREPREGLVADRRTRRRSPPDRGAGTSLRPCDVWCRNFPVRDSSDAFSIHSFDTRNEVFLICRRRSAVRNPRRWRARFRIHPVCPDRVPSGARRGPGGAPA